VSCVDVVNSIYGDFQISNSVSPTLLDFYPVWRLTPVILAMQEAEIRKIATQRQHIQEVDKIPSQPIKKLGIVVCTCQPCYMGSVNKRMDVQASPRHKSETLFKK
jgi:hypothetical protein